MTDRELFEKALKALKDVVDAEEARSWGVFGVDKQTPLKRARSAITALRERLAQPEQMEQPEPDGLSWLKKDSNYFSQPKRKPWVGLTEDEWKELWEKFNDDQDGLEEEFQERMTVKHGEGYYLINPEESWKSQQELIQRLVEDKLKEKNT